MYDHAHGRSHAGTKAQDVAGATHAPGRATQHEHQDAAHEPQPRARGSVFDMWKPQTDKSPEDVELDRENDEDVTATTSSDHHHHPHPHPHLDGQNGHHHPY